jgi:RNA polymerase sigma-70 factor, ECF subfamily
MSDGPPTKTSEEELLRRCATGDNAAWTDFLRRYGAFLDYMVRRALISRRGGRMPSADDVAEVRDEIVAWLLANDGRVLLTYRAESRLTSWLGVVVGRRARRIAQRGQGLRQKTVSLDALTADATSHLAVSSEGESDSRQAALQKLAVALEDLSERDRILLRGAFYDKRSYAELAEEVGVRTDSVGQLLYRAKSRLKKNLGGTLFLESLSGLLLAWLPLVLKGSTTP